MMDSMMKEIQRRAEEFQKNLATLEVEGVAGGGLVRVLMNGLGDVKNVHIDPSLMKPEERAIVEDLVVAACVDGKKKMEAKRFEDSQFISDLVKSFGAPGAGS